MLENNLHRIIMMIAGIVVLAMITAFLFTSGENPNSNSKDNQSYYEQSTKSGIEQSENRTPKY